MFILVNKSSFMAGSAWFPILNQTKDEKVYRYLHAIKNTVPVKYSSITACPHLIHTKPHLTESRLIQLLKDHGIGRPSTFAAIVDKIQEKQYVVKRNILGKKQIVVEYSLNNLPATKHFIKETTIEKTFGQEKDKLVILPLGTLVVEFCIKNWPTLFHYQYTNAMEIKLDSIASSSNNDDKSSHISLCNQCCQDMTHSIAPKFEIKIVDPACGSGSLLT